MLEANGTVGRTVGARNIILTAAAFWVAGAMTARAFEASAVTAQVVEEGEFIPMQKARIQGNLHGLLGLKFEEYVLEKVKAQVELTLGTFDKLSIEAKQKAKDDAIQRLDMFMNGWRFTVAPSRSWTNNTNPTETVSWDLGNTNINAIVHPPVIARVENRLAAALDEAYTVYAPDQPLNATIIETIAQAATTGTSAGFGEWVCIFNPETGLTEWFNETTGQWGGSS